MNSMRQVRQTATKQKEREQKKSKPLARSLQEDYSGSEEKKKRTHAIIRRVKQQ